MPIGAGLSGQLMMKAETTVGTAVTPDTGFEYNSEGLELTKNVVQGQGIRAGIMYNRARRRAYTTRTAGGPINLDVPSTGADLLFKQMFGAVSGTTTKTYTPAALTGQSLTIQKGVPQTDGTVKPFTFSGCKFSAWTLACEVGGILTLDLTVDAWDAVTSTSLVTASYTAADIFHFAEGTVKIGGATVANVRSFSTTTEIGMKTDRYFFGSAGKKAEQTENDYRNTTGTMETEFVNQATIYDLFAADTQTSTELTFVTPGGATLDLTIPAIHFDGETPKVGGPDVVGLTAGFTAGDDGTNPVISLAYTPA